MGDYSFKLADCDTEFEQIHRLNYRTFAEEVPQHEADGTGKLVDKFHARNKYIVALCAGQLVGMVSWHDQPPFSVAARLPEGRILCEPGIRPAEIRLLAIDRSHRGRQVFSGLMRALFRELQARDYTHWFISGVAERTGMYERLGFQPLGPAVPDGRAKFVPMSAAAAAMRQRWNRVMGRQEIQFLARNGAGRH